MSPSSREWPPPPKTHLAPNSLTTAVSIRLKTLWLFWVCWTPSVCYSVDCCRLWGRRFFFFLQYDKTTHELPPYSQHLLTPSSPSPWSTFAFSPRRALFALFYPFAPTSGNRKWHWPLLIPPATHPITFVKRERGAESHIRGRLVIIFAMPSAWINHSGRRLVERRSQPWWGPAATLCDWQLW